MCVGYFLFPMCDSYFQTENSGGHICAATQTHCDVFLFMKRHLAWFIRCGFEQTTPAPVNYRFRINPETFLQQSDLKRQGLCVILSAVGVVPNEIDVCCGSIGTDPKYTDHRRSVKNMKDSSNHSLRHAELGTCVGGGSPQAACHR